MPRRRKPPPAPASADWKSYGPHQAAYWLHGGPWIAPDDIPAKPPAVLTL